MATGTLTVESVCPKFFFLQYRARLSSQFNNQKVNCVATLRSSKIELQLVPLALSPNYQLFPLWTNILFFFPCNSLDVLKIQFLPECLNRKEIKNNILYISHVTQLIVIKLTKKKINQLLFIGTSAIPYKATTIAKNYGTCT